MSHKWQSIGDSRVRDTPFTNYNGKPYIRLAVINGERKQHLLPPPPLFFLLLDERGRKTAKEQGTRLFSVSFFDTSRHLMMLMMDVLSNAHL